MWYLIIIGVLVIIILAVYLEAKNSDDYEEEDNEDNKVDYKLPYRKRKYLLTIPEKKFYDVLKTVVKDDYVIFAKVRIPDLIDSPKWKKTWQTDFNRIRAKHIDFVICDKYIISPLLAIELDDSTHNRTDRKRRDDFVDEAFKVAQLPILHVKSSSQYNSELLLKQIHEGINRKTP